MILSTYLGSSQLIDFFIQYQTLNLNQERKIKKTKYNTPIM